MGDIAIHKKGKSNEDPEKHLKGLEGGLLFPQGSGSMTQTDGRGPDRGLGSLNGFRDLLKQIPPLSSVSLPAVLFPRYVCSVNFL